MSVSRVSPEWFRELILIIRDANITDKGGVEALRSLLDQIKETGTCENPGECVSRLGLGVLERNREGEEAGDPVVKAAREVIADQPRAVADFHAGKKEAMNFLVGQVMKKTRGCAKPADVNQVLLGILTREG